MTTMNDITGDKLVSKRSTDKFRDNYDMIFGQGAFRKEVDTKGREIADQIEDDLVKILTEKKK